MPTADPAAQRALLTLADVDRAADTAAHRRANLPELAAIAQGRSRGEELEAQVVLAQAEVDDLDRAARKLDGEIDAVRDRAARDQQRLAGGTLPPKELEGLQREVESLARRQATLEDEALELMQRREDAESAVVKARAELETVRREVDEATGRRDETWADIDDELARLADQRQELVASIPDDVIAVYERVRGSGKTAAGALIGERCGACQMALDRQSVEQIRAASADAVQRCPECGAILVRTG